MVKVTRWLSTISIGFGAIVFATAMPLWAEEIVIKYPGANTLKSARLMAYEKDFYEAIGNYANADQSVKIEPSSLRMAPNREWAEMIQGNKVNVLISPLQGIVHMGGARVLQQPVMRGLMGFREIIAKRSTLEDLTKVQSLADLREFYIGQPDGWFDLAIYGANDFKIRAGVNIEGTMKMLDHGRFDIFPLGVIEVDEIFSKYSSCYPDLAIDESLLIFYHLPMVLHISPNNPELYAYLEQAVPRMLDDGTLDALLVKHFGDSVAKIRNQSRKVVGLRNPNIPADTALARSEFWFPETKNIH